MNLDVGGELELETWLSLSAIAVSAVAVVISALSWRSAERTNRATIYAERFSVYRDVEQFIRHWVSRGRPDTEDGLRKLVDAWNRSHFLFDRDTTAFIRTVWLEALEAQVACDVIDGTTEGDRKQAVEKKYSLMRKYMAEDSPLRRAFEKAMKV